MPVEYGTETVHRAQRRRIPALDPVHDRFAGWWPALLCTGGHPPAFIAQHGLHQRLTPLAVPTTIIIQRTEHLLQKIIAIAGGKPSEMHHHELVEQRLDDK